MQKKKTALVITLISLLAVCITLMVISLIVSETTFRQISAYIAIACVVIALVGVVTLLRSNIRERKELDQKIKELQELQEKTA